MQTRRASQLEREQSESVRASSEKPTAEIKEEVSLNDTPQPSLLRPTPTPQPNLIPAGDAEMIPEMANLVVTVKDEPVDLDDTPPLSTAKDEVESDSGDETPSLSSSASTSDEELVTSAPVTAVVVKVEPVDDSDVEDVPAPSEDLREISVLPPRATPSASTEPVDDTGHPELVPATHERAIAVLPARAIKSEPTGSSVDANDEDDGGSDEDKKVEVKHEASSVSGGMESDEEDEDEDEARDIIAPMRSLALLPVRARGTRASSVMSVHEAKVDIDNFMADRQAYTAVEDNKLRFWQSLCIEFRVAKTPNASKNQRRKQRDLPPLPTSCTQANKLLKERVHVNIRDYFEARAKPLKPGQVVDYRKLLFPTAVEMVKYTRKNKRYADRDDVKEAWLQPLMRRMWGNK